MAILVDSLKWTPDSKQIAFNSFGGEVYEIYVMDADGGNPQNLTNNPGSDFHPSWFGSAFAVAPGGKELSIWGVKKAAR